METIYLSAAETAKLIRKALRENFPGTTFSVRTKTYSGGASVDIKYTDGPKLADVDQVAQVFAGANFDGMTDCKSYICHVGEGGQTYRYGADFVLVTRHYTPAAQTCAERYVRDTKYGLHRWTVEGAARRVLSMMDL